MRFFIVCTNGHSFCEKCRQQLTKKCPLCRDWLLSYKVEDLTRWRVISEYLDKFYKGLKIGDIVDAKDCDNRWYESRICRIDTDANKVLIHYFGWEDKWNEWRPIQYYCICPKGTHTNDEWFHKIKIRDAIEFKLCPYNSHTKWYIGIVTEIAASKRYIKVAAYREKIEIFKIRLSKDTLCKLYTHCVKLLPHDQTLLKRFGH
jgi:hypothetical protein